MALQSLSHVAPLAFERHIDSLIVPLYRPEAQTRWEVLDAPHANLSAHFDQVSKAFDAAEASLFDDDSATVRLAAFCSSASTVQLLQKHSDEAWPLLDERFSATTEMLSIMTAQGLLRLSTWNWPQGHEEGIVTQREV